jgi:hypothetical protein
VAEKRDGLGPENKCAERHMSAKTKPAWLPLRPMPKGGERLWCGGGLFSGANRLGTGRFDGLQDAQSQAFHQSAADFHAGAPDDAVESLAGNAHVRRGGAVKKVLHIGQADRLQFVRPEDNLLEFVERDTRGFEKITGRLVGNVAGAEGAGHGKSELAQVE